MVARFSTHVQTGPGANTVSCTMGTGSFPVSKERLGRDADPSPLLVPWSRKSTAIPLLPLWTGRPVRSLSASTRVHVTFLSQNVREETEENHLFPALLRVLGFPLKNARSTSCSCYVHCPQTRKHITADVPAFNDNILLPVEMLSPLFQYRYCETFNRLAPELFFF